MCEPTARHAENGLEQFRAMWKAENCKSVEQTSDYVALMYNKITIESK